MNYQTLEVWLSDFKTFIAKANEISEEWNRIPFDLNMLSEREKAVAEEYRLNMSQIDDCYDFRREIQARIEEEFIELGVIQNPQTQMPDLNLSDGD